MTTDYGAINRAFTGPKNGDNKSSLVFPNGAHPGATGLASYEFNPEKLAQYKPLFQKYFKEEDYGKAIWTSFWENPQQVDVSSVGPNPPQGRATGLLQILPRYTDEKGIVQNPNRPTQQELKDPETNIRYAAELVYGKGGKDSGAIPYWGDWQDSPQPGAPIWGALGKHPYPGDTHVNLPATPLPPNHSEQISIAKSAREAAASAVTLSNQQREITRAQLSAKSNIEVERIKQESNGDIHKIAEGLKTVQSNYESEMAAVNLQASVVADVFAKTNTWYNVLSNLPNIIGDKDTSVRNVDDLEKFLNEHSKDSTNFYTRAFSGSQSIPFKFTQEQRDYLDTAIQHLYPYIGGKDNAPASMQQLSEFLAAAGGSSVPSHRVSLASLSTDGIKKLLTTAPSGNVKLPPGLTAEKLRAYYVSNNLLDDESKKNIEGLQGKAKDLVRQWNSENARIEAYKLGIADPTNSVPLLKERENNIITWGLDKLEVYSSNVVRPIAAYGLSGFGAARDIANNVPFASELVGAANPVIGLLNRVYSDEDTDELRGLIRKNKHEGMNFWEAAGNGFEHWDGNLLQKMLAETIADPTTYLGFGVYTKLFKPIPYLGKAVEMGELGWKLAFDNPVVNKATLSLAGAGIGYQISDGNPIGIAVGAGFPALRHIPLYTSAQLTERISRGIKSSLEEALLVNSHATSLAALTPEQYRDTIVAGLDAIKNNPTTAHLTSQGRAVKGIINILDPWIDNDTIATWFVQSSQGARIVERGTITAGKEVIETPAMNRIIAREITQDEQLAINKTYDSLLSHEERGTISLDSATDQMMNTLNLSGEESFNAIKSALIERLDMQTQRLLDAAVGNDVADIHMAIGNKVKASALSNYQHPLSYHAQFQGLINGLNRKVDPITRWKGYQWMANAQNWYAHSMLSFFNFKPFNYIETHFRAALGGGGWDIPLNSDEISATLYAHGWHADIPNDIKQGVRGNQDFEFTRVKRGETNIPELQKKAGLIEGLKDIASLGFLNRLEKQKKAQVIDRSVWRRLAENAPEEYGNLKQFADGISSILQTEGLSTNEVAGRMADLKNAWLRPDAPEVIRNLKTDVASATKKKLITDIYQSAQQYHSLDQLITDKVIRDVEAGRITTIDETFSDNLDLLLDMPAVKAQRGEQALREMRVQLETVLSEASTPKEVQRGMKFLIDSQQSINMNAGELRSTSTTRGHRISGVNKTDHWEYSNKALYNYLDTSTAEFPAMVESVRRRVAQFFPDQVDSYNTILDNMIQRNNLSSEARRKDLEIFSTFETENGRRPQTKAEWDTVNLKRETIWDEYRRRDTNLLIEHQVMSEGLSPSIGQIIDVNNTGLTLPNVAQLLTSSGDELAQSLVIGNSLQSRENWVSSVYGTAKAKASQLGKTPEELGWAKEAVTGVYDNLRVRAGTDPADDGVLYLARQELESLRKDVHLHAMNAGYKPESIDVINEQYEAFAKYAEEHPSPRQAVDKSYQAARVDYQHMFTDYDNGNIFDAFMRGIFPFWYYQASRWPYLTTEALRHPGLITGFGRYQNYTEKGYTHIPGVDLAFNVARGTILMGGMSGLIRQFPARYEDGVFGTFAHGLDQLGRAGFYPGLWSTLPLALLKINDFQLSPPIETGINATRLLGWNGLADLQERIFPNRFKEFYTAELASKLSQERQLGVSGSDIRRKIDAGTATEEEKAVWREAQHNLAGYQILFDQTGILKLDIEEKRASAREIAQFIEDNMGISKEKQDAITDRLGDSGYRLLDFIPMDPATQKRLYELTRYKYWSGNNNSLNPPEFKKLEDKIGTFWDEVEKINVEAKNTGFKDRNGQPTPSLNDLDEQFKSGKLAPRDYLKQMAGVKIQRNIKIDTLKNDPNYKGVPITLEQREEYRRTHDIPMPVNHPAKELLDYYNQIPLDNDAQGDPDWNKYFASIDGLLAALPEDKKNYLLDYIQRDWTSSQKLYWQSNGQFIRPYMNLREGILQSIDPSQQSLVRQYEDASSAKIKNLSELEQQIVSDYNAALGRARTKYRQLDPETDAWLFYWGKTSTLQTESARRKYNELIKRYGGGVTYNNPIDETKTKPLPALS